MLAVSNTGVGFLSGSVGGDEDTLSLSRTLYIPLPLLRIPSQLLFVHQGGNFQTPISNSTLSLSSVSSRDAIVYFGFRRRASFPALVGWC